jgi:hypothetical protein
MKAMIILIVVVAMTIIPIATQLAVAEQSCSNDFNVYGKQYCPSNITPPKKWWDFLIPNKKLEQKWANYERSLERDHLLRNPLNRESELTTMLRTFF